MSSKQEWPGTTYGSSWMHRWLIKMLKHIDPRAIYVFVAIFVVPVCLLVNPGQKVIYHYFRKIWKYSPWRSFLLTYKNFYLFGQVVVDKFAMYAGKKFDIDIEGYEHFLHLVEQSDGFLQLSAHIGNYEIAGYSLVAKQKKFNALVFGGEKASVMENRNKMFDGTKIHPSVFFGRYCPFPYGTLFRGSVSLTSGSCCKRHEDLCKGVQNICYPTAL